MMMMMLCLYLADTEVTLVAYLGLHASIKLLMKAYLTTNIKTSPLSSC